MSSDTGYFLEGKKEKREEIFICSLLNNLPLDKLLLLHSWFTYTTQPLQGFPSTNPVYSTPRDMGISSKRRGGNQSCRPLKLEGCGSSPNPTHLIPCERQDGSPKRSRVVLVVTQQGWDPVGNGPQVHLEKFPWEPSEAHGIGLMESEPWPCILQFFTELQFIQF